MRPDPSAAEPLNRHRARDAPGPGVAQLSVVELLQREGRGEEPASAAPRNSMAYRVLAVTAGLIVLLGAITAGATALSGPRADRPMPTTTDLQHVAGAGVVRPGLIGTELHPEATAPPSAADTSRAPGDGSGTPEPAPRAGQHGDLPSGRDAAAAPSGRTVPPAGSDGEHAPEDTDRPLAGDEEPDAADSELIADTVTTFFRSVLTAPADAYALLGPEMRGSGYEDFVASWSDVEQVGVDIIRMDGPDAAIVAVTLHRADGAVLRNLQRVVVSTAGPPRIEHARLLTSSAS
ncbi:MAG: hypothetical protein GEV09_03665 [Pseudonocardiaceae bacterium]|nr:hypothetical protein [Pseudonocardiaceae bacterium]